MDITTFENARSAYDAQDWETAAILFSLCADGPDCGEANHLRGNALMRLGRTHEAIDAYRMAADDTSYPNRGAVLTNLGKAQVALGDYAGAVESLKAALEDPDYPGAYKAMQALGNAYSHLGDPRSAGVAYRKAALEANNPDPAKALINLGVCFVQLRRPADAAEAYRTALDFSQDADERNMIQSNLGQAYVASNRMAEAVAAFRSAMDNGYQLLPMAQADYERAVKAAGNLAQSASVSAGYASAGFDPLDPTGKSGEMMPSPDQSGFFDISDEQIEAVSRAVAKNEKRNKSGHVGLKVLIVLLLLLIAAVVGGIALYLNGYGMPSQESSISSVFSAPGDASAQGWSSVATDSYRELALADVTPGSQFSIAGLDMSASTSSAIVQVTLPKGGTMLYDVDLVREGIGWKVSSAQVVHTAVDSTTYQGITA